METEYFNIDTVSPKNVLTASLIRSPLPTGTIKAIEFPPLPEGYFSLTYKDIPGENFIRVAGEIMPVLCREEISYKGEIIAAICGPDKSKVLSLCRSTKISSETNYTFKAFKGHSPDQIVKEKKFTKGNPEKIFEDALSIVEGTYHTAARKARFTSYRGVIARSAKGILEIQTETQWPFHLRNTVAAVCSLPAANVKTAIGKFNPTYDEKLLIPTIYASLASLLSLKTGKPVRFVPDREEMLDFSSRKPEVLIRRKSAVDEKGKIIAEMIDIEVNLGAYPLFSDEILTQLIVGAAGSYSIPNLSIKCRGITTSEPPMNVFNGLNLSSGVFSCEAHLSRIAEINSCNPGDWRLKYLPGKPAYIPTGGIEKEFNGKELLARIIQASDFNRKYSAYEVLRKHRKPGRVSRELLRGIGISFGFAGNGFSGRKESGESYTVAVNFDRDNKVTIRSSANGSSSTTVWKETASSILGVDADSVKILKGDTSTLLNSGPSFLGSDISIVTSLVEKCCLAIKKQRFHKALPIEVKRSYRSSGVKRWDPVKLKGMPFHSLSWGAVVAEVEIDPVFLRPIVRALWMIVDSGRLYNKSIAVKSLESSILETLEWIVTEDDVTSPSVTDTGFNTPLRRKLPDISVIFSEKRKNITGGISQLPDTFIPAAIISAVSQATGIYPDSLPLTPQILYKQMEGA